MNIKKFYIMPIKGYQYISKMLPANCRYYPSCSEYAKLQFEFNVTHKAFIESSLRILRCNQFFDGGVDYPVITYVPPKLLSLFNFNNFYGKIEIIYWFVPKDTNHSQYYILKDFNAIRKSNYS